MLRHPAFRRTDRPAPGRLLSLALVVTALGSLGLVGLTPDRLSAAPPVAEELVVASGEAIDASLAPAAMLVPHVQDQAYIFLRVYEDSLGVTVEITTRDLERALGFGWDLDAGVGLAEVQALLGEIRAYMEPRFELSSAATGVMTPVFRTVDMLSVDFGDFVVLEYMIDGLAEVPDLIDVEFTPLFEVDGNHRNLLVIWHNWKTATFNNEAIPSLIFSPNNPRQTLDLTSASWLRGFIGLIRLGVLHIWIGIDHIFFLMALVLPSVLLRRDDEFQPADSFKGAFLNILGIVTAFTVAHSITLALAGMNIVQLPSRFVESVIAFSIAVAAAANLMPRLNVKEWMVAFGFGLFHGFGFASVMGDIGVGREHLALSVFGFNVGVELGQLAIIVVVFPALFLFRRHRLYGSFMKFGSWALIAVAMIWFSERAFDFNIPLTDTILYLPRMLGGLVGIGG